jgi:hypothetical protein
MLEPRDFLAERITGSAFISENIFNGVSFMGQPCPVIKVKNLKGRQTDFISSGDRLPVISNSFKCILELSGTDRGHLEFLHVEFENCPELNHKYWLLNILHPIKCFDWEKSEYTVYDTLVDNEKWPDEITRLVMLDEEIGGRNIFRMHEKSTDIFVSHTLQEAILSNKLSGITFTESPDLSLILDPK